MILAHSGSPPKKQHYYGVSPTHFPPFLFSVLYLFQCHCLLATRNQALLVSVRL